MTERRNPGGRNSSERQP